MQNTPAARPHACRINSLFGKPAQLLPSVPKTQRLIVMQFLQLRASLLLSDEAAVREIKRQADSLLDAAQARLDAIERDRVIGEGQGEGHHV